LHFVGCVHNHIKEETMRLSYASVAACAAAFALTVSVAAQTTAPAGQSQPASPAATSQAGAVTLEGCLAREDAVPGREPNIVERRGIMEDYILTSTKVVKGSAPASSSAQTDRPTGTSGATAMYHVKGLNDDRLKTMVGKRVQVEGTLSDLDKPTPGSTDLPDINATTIRQVTGDCAAKP
jgi:hypothetical protein